MSDIYVDISYTFLKLKLILRDAINRSFGNFLACSNEVYVLGNNLHNYFKLSLLHTSDVLCTDPFYPASSL